MKIGTGCLIAFMLVAYALVGFAILFEYVL